MNAFAQTQPWRDGLQMAVAVVVAVGVVVVVVVVVAVAAVVDLRLEVVAVAGLARMRPLLVDLRKRTNSSQKVHIYYSPHYPSAKP